MDVQFAYLQVIISLKGNETAIGWVFVGISNQGGVAAGFKSIENTVAEMQFTLELLPQLSAIYFCPDFEGNILYKVSSKKIENWERSQFPHPNVKGELLYQSFRKPGSGMIMKGIDDLDEMPDQLWMIGDHQEDEAAAQTAGVNFMWADIWRNRFLPRMYEFKLITKEQVEFLEGIKLS
ncbi:MAG: polynucleotide kinase [Hapalosiphonaceae cyanobacterium JJU2]|nr:MAG: polynucleotide kinase [Hapalosiphonaceae cyanobacterium JJU2]